MDLIKRKMYSARNCSLYRQRHPTRIKLNSIRERARKKGLDFDLTKEDIVYPLICPILGIPIKIGKFKNQDNNPSVDRIDNHKGYTRNNIRVISKRANSLKSNATIEELELILADMKRIQHDQGQCNSL